jgi:cyclic beta-1,2-glucan synthetase
MALARLNDGPGAVKLLQMMNPIESSRGPEDVERYQGEPYVVAADVSSAPGKIGRAGWTWYTGSAGWMYRIWIEEVLGFKIRGNTFTMAPAIPDDWNEFELVFRYRSATYEISVRRDGHGEGIAMEEDGQPLEGAVVNLADDGRTHRIGVLLPLPPSRRSPAPREAALQESP